MYCEDCGKEFNSPGKYCLECEEERSASREEDLSYSDGHLNESTIADSVIDSKRITKASNLAERQSPIAAIQRRDEEARLTRELEDARERYTNAEFTAQQQRDLAKQTQQELIGVKVTLYELQEKYAGLEKEKVLVERRLNEKRERETYIESDVKRQRELAEQAQQELDSIKASFEELQRMHAKAEKEKEQAQMELRESRERCEKAESIARQQKELAERSQQELDRANALLQGSQKSQMLDGRESKAQSQDIERSTKLELVIYGVILGIVLASLLACLIYFLFK
jgi:hypothetical protein